MAQFRLQVVLPDRPGSLGAVASAIGFAGGDSSWLGSYENLKMVAVMTTSQLLCQVQIQ